jgi:hypothetical protein
MRSIAPMPLAKSEKCRRLVAQRRAGGFRICPSLPFCSAILFGRPRRRNGHAPDPRASVQILGHPGPARLMDIQSRTMNLVCSDAARRYLLRSCCVRHQEKEKICPHGHTTSRPSAILRVAGFSHTPCRPPVVRAKPYPHRRHFRAGSGQRPSLSRRCRAFLVPMPDPPGRNAVYPYRIMDDSVSQRVTRAAKAFAFGFADDCESVPLGFMSVGPIRAGRRPSSHPSRAHVERSRPRGWARLIAEESMYNL